MMRIIKIFNLLIGRNPNRNNNEALFNNNNNNIKNNFLKMLKII